MDDGRVAECQESRAVELAVRLDEDLVFVEHRQSLEFAAVDHVADEESARQALHELLPDLLRRRRRRERVPADDSPLGVPLLIYALVDASEDEPLIQRQATYRCQQVKQVMFPLVRLWPTFAEALVQALVDVLASLPRLLDLVRVQHDRHRIVSVQRLRDHCAPVDECFTVLPDLIDLVNRKSVETLTQWHRLRGGEGGLIIFFFLGRFLVRKNFLK